MKFTFVFFIFFVISNVNFCQNGHVETVYNLDFEMVENGFAKKWYNPENEVYSISLDSGVVKSGKYSVRIEFIKGEPGFMPISLVIPENYEGKKITLTGYIRTENVTDGYAGLWMRIDPKVAFDNMSRRGIVGTQKWTQCEISLPMDPKNTKQIVIGALLKGKGCMWVDNLSISIDGESIINLEPVVIPEPPAASDKRFDNGSGINIGLLSEQQVENLRTLGLIWGFLKYYHPAVAQGNFNWDYELFDIMPKILNAPDLSARDSLYTEWIHKLGTFAEQSATTLPDNSAVKMKPDLEWINQSGFSNELVSMLNQVKNADRNGENYYVGLAPDIGNPEFTHENAYDAMKYPDDGFRLLSLFRYWNIIQYYFPYKYLIEEDWKEVLPEFIPKFITAADETGYTMAVLELTGRVHDTHANIWGGNETIAGYRGTRYTALKTDFVENMAVVSGYYDQVLGIGTGLVPGDIITAVNAKPVSQIVNDNLKYSPASNYPTQLRDIGENLLRSNEDSINITYLHEGIGMSRTIKTYRPEDLSFFSGIPSANDTCFQMIDNNIAYLDNGLLKRAYLPELWKHIQHTRGLIIDNRNYPSDFPIYDLCNYLMPQSTAFVKFTHGSITTPGLFDFAECLYVGYKNKKYYKGKVIILVNEQSQSSSEYHAMAYRVHPNATVVGSTTAGADGNVSGFYLPGGIFSMISGIGVYYPDGSETQRIGIVPDITVLPHIDGIKNNRDEVLEKAIEMVTRP